MLPYSVGSDALADEVGMFICSRCRRVPEPLRLCRGFGLAPGLVLDAESQQNDAKSRQSSALEKSPDTVGEQNSALSQQNPSTSTHEKCVPSVSKNPDLDQVVAAWDDLPDLIKAQILELVKTST